MTNINYKEVKRVLSKRKEIYKNMQADTKEQNELKNALVKACDEVLNMIIQPGVNNITAEHIKKLCEEQNTLKLNLKYTDPEKAEHHLHLSMVLNWIYNDLHIRDLITFGYIMR